MIEVEADHPWPVIINTVDMYRDHSERQVALSCKRRRNAAIDS